MPPPSLDPEVDQLVAGLRVYGKERQGPPITRHCTKTGAPAIHIAE